MRVRINFYKDKIFYLFLSNTELTDWLFIPKIQKEGTSLLAHCFSSAYYYILTLLTRFVYKQRVLKRIVSVSRKIRLKAIHNIEIEIRKQ